MTTITPRPWRWASVVTAIGLAAALSGCGIVDLGDLVDTDGQPSASPGDEQNVEPEPTAAQLASAECFVGTWQMDNSTMSSLLMAAGVLASESIQGTSLLVVQPDGTATIEHLGWTYEMKAPPNPMLGGQGPETLTITNDSSSTATYGIDEAGVITLTANDDGTTKSADPSPRVLTCEGDQVVEEIEDLGGAIVYDRRG